MSQNRLNLRDRVLTCGAGARRAVLDYEAGLAYQYDDPSNVTAYYEAGKGWIVRDQPYYSSGGWGSGASGDAEGYYLVSGTREMLRAIDAKVYEVNSLTFLTRTEIQTLQKSIKKHNELIKAQNEIAKKLGETKVKVKELEPIPTYKLKLVNKSPRGTSPRGVDVITTALVYKGALEVFANRKGRPVKVSDYTVSKDVVRQGRNVVAFRDSEGQVFLNSQVLQVTQFEEKFLGNQSLIQKELRKLAKYSIPFNVLAAADLKLSETKILEQGPESTHLLNNGYGPKIERHFTGALLLENAGRKFLMDIDRVEIEHGIFNPFFVEVRGDVTTIAGAYDSMKPQEVKDAETQGKTVKRQGEWFFIDTGLTLTVNDDNVLSWDQNNRKGVVLRHQIAHGKGRPNNLYKPVGFGELDAFVCGTVSHTGREHADLDLGQENSVIEANDIREDVPQTTFKLWKVVPNTTIGNFTITGDID